MSGIAHRAHDRTDIDDAAFAGLHHAAQHGLGQAIDGFQIGFHDGIPVFFLHAHQQLVTGDAGIVDQDADRTISTVDVADQAFNLLCTFIDVEFDALAAKRRQTLADGDGTGFCRGGTDHDGPFPGQRIGNGSTDAAGGTGNEDDFAL